MGSRNETTEHFNRRIADRRTHMFYGNTALRDSVTDPRDEALLLGLPKRRRPKFLDEFVPAMAALDLAPADVRQSDRLLFAHNAHDYIIGRIYEQNEKHVANGEAPLKLSPIHTQIPRKLNLYYAAFHSSLTEGQESERMRLRRLEKLEQDTDTARTYLPMRFADLKMVDGLQLMLADFYPGPAAEAATEILAAYGANRERLQFLHSVPEPGEYE